VEIDIQIRSVNSPTDIAQLRQRLVELLAVRSTRRGEFRLASGRMSSLYIDARMTTMSPEGLALIGPLVLHTLREAKHAVDSVGGLTLGADPIAYATSVASMTFPPVVRAFTVRKEAKEHGAGKQIEGPFQPGDMVAVVEDVITTGASALRAAAALRDGGAGIACVVGLVDREEGGREAIEAAGYTVLSLCTATEITRHLDSL
jgi:orotate phosphoribosyltransferase